MDDLDRIRCDVNDDVLIAPNIALKVTVDEMDLSDVYAYRVQSSPGGFIFEIGKLLKEFGFEEGSRFPAVVAGYWILLKPLSPGVHTVSFSADFQDEDGNPVADGVPDLGANYTLIVDDDDDDDDED